VKKELPPQVGDLLLGFEREKKKTPWEEREAHQAHECSSTWGQGIGQRILKCPSFSSLGGFLVFSIE
jgi:hypothetical protein